MYSYEIQQLMELKQYVLEAKEYLNILNTSPQINNVSYNTYSDLFHIGTDDRYSWDFKVYLKNNR